MDTNLVQTDDLREEQHVLLMGYLSLKTGVVKRKFIKDRQGVIYSNCGWCIKLKGSLRSKFNEQ